VKRYELVIDVYSVVTREYREVIDPCRWLWSAKVLRFLHLTCPPPPGGTWIVVDAFIRDARR
jgi:hypothetical protein